MFADKIKIVVLRRIMKIKRRRKMKRKSFSHTHERNMYLLASYLIKVLLEFSFLMLDKSTVRVWNILCIFFISFFFCSFRDDSIKCWKEIHQTSVNIWKRKWFGFHCACYRFSFTHVIDVVARMANAVSKIQSESNRTNWGGFRNLRIDGFSDPWALKA